MLVRAFSSAETAALSDISRANIFCAAPSSQQPSHWSCTCLAKQTHVTDHEICPHGGGKHMNTHTHTRLERCPSVMHRGSAAVQVRMRSEGRQVSVRRFQVKNIQVKNMILLSLDQLYYLFIQHCVKLDQAESILPISVHFFFWSFNPPTLIFFFFWPAHCKSVVAPPSPTPPLAHDSLTM